MSSKIIRSRELTWNHQHSNMRNFFPRHSYFTEKKNYKESFRWYCEICSLMLSSKIQAQEHFFGKKHQNLVKSKHFYYQDFNEPKINSQSTLDKKGFIMLDRYQNPSKSFDENLKPGYEICDSNNVIPPPASRDNILETVIKSEKKTFYSSDLSIYRTPSGKYYCQLCNITVNSQAQFLQHSRSKKHCHRANKTSLKVKKENQNSHTFRPKQVNDSLYSFQFLFPSSLTVGPDVVVPPNKTMFY